MNAIVTVVDIGFVAGFYHASGRRCGAVGTGLTTREEDGSQGLVHEQSSIDEGGVPPKHLQVLDRGATLRHFAELAKVEVVDAVNVFIGQCAGGWIGLERKRKSRCADAAPTDVHPRLIRVQGGREIVFWVGKAIDE